MFVGGREQDSEDDTEDDEKHSHRLTDSLWGNGGIVHDRLGRAGEVVPIIEHHCEGDVH